MPSGRLPWLKAVLGGVALAAAVLAVAGVVIWWLGVLDRYFIFFPEREVTVTPADRGLAFEEVSFTAADGTRLHGWYVPGASDVTWLWFHGNGGNIADRLDALAALHRNLGVNIFIFDYRGYGKSEGRPTEKGMYLDGEAALAYLRTRLDVDVDKVVLYGRSLGCAVAVEMASRHGAYALVLESPFTSVKAMARRAFPVLPAWLLVKSRFDSLAKIREMDTPLLVIHPERDEIVPLAMGREVYEAAAGPKRFFVAEGALHNDQHLADSDPYFRELRGFLVWVGERGWQK
jgi:fermentation-respiration switch protein FrsA (DUF1100 family)